MQPAWLIPNNHADVEAPYAFHPRATGALTPKTASKPASQARSQLLPYHGQPAGHPASQAASQPTTTHASQAARQPAPGRAGCGFMLQTMLISANPGELHVVGHAGFPGAKLTHVFFVFILCFFCVLGVITQKNTKKTQKKHTPQNRLF